MADVFNLDFLAPEPKKIQIQGKVFLCKPPTIAQLIKMQKVWEALAKEPTSENQQKLLDDVLYELLPDLKDNPEIGLTYQQLDSLVAYLQNAAIEKKDIQPTTESVTPEKKTA